MTALHNQTTANIKEKSNLIWSIADLIREYYKPHEYGKVILPMCVIKRFNDVLAPTRHIETVVLIQRKWYQHIAGDMLKSLNLRTLYSFLFSIVWAKTTKKKNLCCKRQGIRLGWKMIISQPKHWLTIITLQPFCAAEGGMGISVKKKFFRQQICACGTNL